MGPILETKWVECGASVDTRGIMGESAKCKVRSSGWGDFRSLRTESIQLSMKTNNINKGSTKYILVKLKKRNQDVCRCHKSSEINCLNFKDPIINEIVIQSIRIPNSKPN